VNKDNIVQEWCCPDLKNMISCYLIAVDNFVDSMPNTKFSETKLKFSEFQTDFEGSIDTINKSLSGKIKIYRSYVKFTPCSKSYPEIIIKFFEIESISDSNKQITIQSKSTNRNFVFNFKDNILSNRILQLVLKNSKKFLDNIIKDYIQPLTEVNEFVLKVSGWLKNWENDLISVDIIIGDEFLEIRNENEKSLIYNLRGILIIGKDTLDNLPFLNIYFSSGESLNIILEEKHVYLIISLLITMLEEKNTNSFSFARFVVGEILNKNIINTKFTTISELTLNINNNIISEFLRDPFEYPILENFILGKIDLPYQIQLIEFLVRYTPRLRRFYPVLQYQSQIQKILLKNKLGELLTVEENKIFTQGSLNKDFDKYHFTELLYEKIKEEGLNEDLEIESTLEWGWNTLSFVDDQTYLISNILDLAIDSCLQTDSIALAISSGFFLQTQVQSQDPRIKLSLLSNKTSEGFLFKSTKFLLESIENGNIISPIHSNQISRILKLLHSIVFLSNSFDLKSLAFAKNLMTSTLILRPLTFLALSNIPDLIYLSTMLLNLLLVNSNNSSNLSILQQKLLNNSTIFIFSLSKAIDLTTTSKMRKIFIFILCNLLLDNPQACMLIQRILPKSFFLLVEDPLGDPNRWSISHWESLFRYIRKDFDTPTNQWNENSRQDLLKELLVTVNEFCNCYKPLLQNNYQTHIEYFFENEKLTQEQEQDLLQLRWNHEEYEIRHNSLESKLPVYHYYIRALVSFTINPYLKIDRISKPARLWEELSALLSEPEIEIKVQYVCCLILIYKDYFKQVKPKSLLTQLITYLKNCPDALLRYYLLQLVAVLLDFDIGQSNTRKFMENDGLNTILKIASEHSFQTDLIVFDYFALEKEFLDPLKYNPSFPITYYPPSLERQALTPCLRQSNELLLIIYIFKNLLLKTKSQTTEKLKLFPMPESRKILFKGDTILLIHQLLRVQDNLILKSILELIRMSYIDQYNIESFLKQDQRFIPYLITKLSSCYQIEIAQFLEVILLELSKSSIKSRKDLMDDLKIFKMISPITSLLPFKGEERKSEMNKEYIDLLSVFPGFILFPPYLWHILLKNGKHEFIDVLFNSKTDNQFLYWDQNSFQSLLTQIYPYTEESSLPLSPIHLLYTDQPTLGAVLLRKWVYGNNIKLLSDYSDLNLLLKMLIMRSQHTLQSIKEGKNARHSYLNEFLLLTHGLSMMSKQMIIDNTEFEYLTTEYIKYYIWIQNSLFRGFTRYERNYLDASLVNFLKIIKNNINKKLSNKLKSLLFALIQRIGKVYITNTNLPSYWQIIIDIYILKIFRFNLKSDVINFLSNTKNEEEKISYSIYSILCNFELNIIYSYFTIFTTNSEIVQTNHNVEIANSDERLSVLEDIGSILLSENAFRRKRTFDFQNDESEEGNWTGGKSNKVEVSEVSSVSSKPDEIDVFQNEDKHITENEIESIIKAITPKYDQVTLSELENNGPFIPLNMCIKTLDFNQLKQNLPGIDLSITCFDSILNQFKKQSDDSIKKNKMNSIIEFAIKLNNKIFKMFNIWKEILIILVDNPASFVALIEFGLPLSLIQILFCSNSISDIHDKSIKFDFLRLNNFLKEIAKLLQRILLKCSIITANLDSEWAEVLSCIKVNNQEHDIIKQIKNQSIVYFFNSFSSLITWPFLFRLISLSDEAILKCFEFNVFEHDLIINMKIRRQMQKIIKVLISDSVISQKQIDFDKMKSATPHEINKLLNINGVFLEGYLKNPVFLEYPNLFINKSLSFLLDETTSKENSQIFIDFILKIKEQENSKPIICETELLLLCEVLKIYNSPSAIQMIKLIFYVDSFSPTFNWNFVCVQKLILFLILKYCCITKDNNKKQIIDNELVSCFEKISEIDNSTWIINILYYIGLTTDQLINKKIISKILNQYSNQFSSISNLSKRLLIISNPQSNEDVSFMSLFENRIIVHPLITLNDNVRIQLIEVLLTQLKNQLFAIDSKELLIENKNYRYVDILEEIRKINNIKGVIFEDIDLLLLHKINNREFLQNIEFKNISIKLSSNLSSEMNNITQIQMSSILLINSTRMIFVDQTLNLNFMKKLKIQSSIEFILSIQYLLYSSIDSIKQDKIYLDVFINILNFEKIELHVIVCLIIYIRLFGVHGIFWNEIDLQHKILMNIFEAKKKWKHHILLSSLLNNMISTFIMDFNISTEIIDTIKITETMDYLNHLSFNIDDFVKVI
jgi:hypothetical protein